MATKTEKQKMLAGEPYLAADPELVRGRTRARRLTRQYNLTTEDETKQRLSILTELLGAAGKNMWIEPPFYCDYGSNIFIADAVYLNFGCVILDCNTIHIGKNVNFGPSVHVYAACHPTDARLRLAGLELTAPVTIGDNVWVGGEAIICPGVTVGENTTIGAGSIVVEDIPANVVAVGNPCRVIRQLE